MVKVQCIKCSREGSLTKKQTKSKGITYEYWYIEHHIGDKIKWCYLGKYEKLPEEYKRLIHKDTQTDTQNIPTRIQTTNNRKLRFSNQTKGLAREKVSVGFNTDMPTYLPIMSRRRIFSGFLRSTFSCIRSASSLMTSILWCRLYRRFSTVIRHFSPE